jgi:hypothetical protein
LNHEGYAEASQNVMTGQVVNAAMHRISIKVLAFSVNGIKE